MGGGAECGLQKLQDGIRLFVKAVEHGKFWKQSGATLRHVGRIFRTTEMPQWRARTWLQLMCCALTLELGVLILEWAGKV